MYKTIKLITRLLKRLRIIKTDFNFTLLRLKITFDVFIPPNSKSNALITIRKVEPGKFVENFPKKTLKIKYIPIPI